VTSPSLLLYPELHRIAPERRPELLLRARHQPFDWIELAGLGAAVVLVAWASKGIAAALPGIVGASLANALVAVPLVLAFAGPFYWRRTRRALRDEIERQARDGRREAP